jgi:hypothetical protein
MPISTLVTTGSPPDLKAAGPLTTRVFRAPAHSGHWKPTEACTMQAGQIGRSQRWHRTPATRSGWR